MTTSNTSNFKIQPQLDAKTNKCVPKYPNFTPSTNLNAPAWQVIANPARAGEFFKVKDQAGNDVSLSAEWIAGFVDGEGTLTFYLNENRKNKSALGQVQSAFITVQGEADYYLLTAIASFFGCGTVSVNRADATSVRYQYRIVNISTQTDLVIPFFRAVKLRTKKGNEFKVWSKWTIFFEKKEHYKNWPNGMISLLEGIKSLKYEGSPTKQALNFIKTCDKWIDKVKTLQNCPFK